jgi:hypothetical protein
MTTLTGGAGVSSTSPIYTRQNKDYQSVFEQTFKNIDDVLWKEAGCTTELDYIE